MGQFRPEKNYELAIESFARLREKDRGLFRNCELIFAGGTRD